MDDFFRLLADRHGGVFTTAQALDIGLSHHELYAGVRDHAMVKLRHGVYADRERFDAADDDGKYLMRVRAAMFAVHDSNVASHVSAAACHRLPLWGLDLTTVHVTRAAGTGRGGRTESGITHHRGLVLTGDVVQANGLAVTSPSRAVVETLAIAPFEPALALADAALYAKLVTEPELRARANAMAGWPHSQHVRRVIDLADGLAESPGESRLRLLLHHAGFPPPDLQVPLHDTAGLIGRVDFLFRDHHTIVEFDGKLKYRTRQDLYDEKDREDRLRALDYEVVRVVWADLESPERVANKIRAAFTRAATRRRT